jgi:hypothetical protein
MMTKETEEMIQGLARAARPVRPLPGPHIRAAVWLVISLGYITAILILMPAGHNILSQLSNPSFAIEQAATLSTGVAAAIAALITIIPGRTPRWSALPLLPLMIWLATLAPPCMREFKEIGLQAFLMPHSLWCVPAMVMFGTVPAVAMVMMIRRGAPLTPHLTAALGGLAAAGIGNVGVRLVHPEDVSVMLIVSHIGGVMALSALAAGAGRLFLNWRSITAASKNAVQ